jgi:hypothetical protein
MTLVVKTFITVILKYEGEISAYEINKTPAFL